MAYPESWADSLRYGRDWRGDVEVSTHKYHPRFNLFVFLNDAHREEWLEEQRQFKIQADCLTEREMAACVEAESRDKLLAYFLLDDDATKQDLHDNGRIGVYARACTMGLLGPDCCKEMPSKDGD